MGKKIGKDLTIALPSSGGEGLGLGVGGNNYLKLLSRHAALPVFDQDLDPVSTG